MSGLKISELPSGEPTLSGIIPFTNDAKNTTFHADVKDFLKLASLSGLSDVDLNVAEINDGYLISYSGGTWIPVSGVSIKINNEGDNRLLTSAGDGEIDAESNLTFNGNLLSITGNILANSGTLDRLIFNTSLGDPDLDIAQLAWNPTEGTVDLGISDSYAMHIGEELHYRVRNNTGSTLLKGTPVYASGVTAGGNPRIVVAPFTADGLTREVRFMGLVTENVNTGINGYTTHFGYIRGIDTRGNAAANGTTNKLWAADEPSWSEGDILYPHPTVAGKLTKVEPKHSISVAIILNRHQNSGKIFVRPTSYGHLDDNHDVNVGGVTGGQFLQYNSATDYWVPSSSGNFTSLSVNNTSVSINGHTHISSDITNFNSSVSGLLTVTNISQGPGILVSPNNKNFTISLNTSNFSNDQLFVLKSKASETYINDRGLRSGNTNIGYDPINGTIQTITLNGSAVTFNKGSGWPTASNVSVEVILRITVSSPTTITWNIVTDWFSQPPDGQAEPLSTGVHLFLLRSIGSSIIEGHYKGNKTN